MRGCGAGPTHAEVDVHDDFPFIFRMHRTFRTISFRRKIRLIDFAPSACNSLHNVKRNVKVCWAASHPRPQVLQLLLQTLDRPAVRAPELPPDVETLAVGAASGWVPPQRQTEAR